MTEAIETRKIEMEVAPVLALATALVIGTPEQRQRASDALRQIKDAQRKATEFFRPMKQSADAHKKAILDAERTVTAPLNEAESLIKRKAMDYDRAEQERVEAERRRLQAIADEQARRERERLEKEAARLKTPELKEARLEQAAAVSAPVVQIAEPPKPKGESVRTLHRARCIDKAALVNAASQGNDLAAQMLTYDPVAGNRLATALKGAVNVPGIEWYTEQSMATR